METIKECQSLNDIKLRKEIIRNAILEDEKKIGTLWHSLFKPSDIFDRNASPSKRITSFINTGAGIIDGAILGWKLYRKFRR